MPSSPMRIIASLLEKLSTMDAVADASEPLSSNMLSDSEEPAPSSTATTGMQTAIETLILKLQNMSLLGLVSPTTITSETHLQHNTTFPISPVWKFMLVPENDFQPQTSNEALFLALLCESKAANMALHQEKQ
ncbi:hypothetical protein PAXRUDRAFT_22422 [Paxillus rubicundulus Ve08.2h10]|uniref:Uncharacterized protein n=1 Tax=Paxillus rubicundulus Ve08.2h10 TaxID=930991 RepID=A0A0D0D5F9_9AGAM|nr:hypothetical protein PAXRUDRAFT_22422 [Paxillus rubicundulus Ve08.2h10]